ncbi:alpha 1,2 mannosyltransferase [Ascosphaera aggregata]|nr:alpha 1,2 mannosyltransferase [Ascosphaera aggregata]
MTLIGIYVDTSYYASPSTEPTITRVFTAPVFTPWNNLRYNSQVANLAEHGLHSRFQHFIVNMFELLGPVYILVLLSMISGGVRKYYSLRSPRAIAALSAIGLLSIFPHQEARFLLPCVPLLLTCIRKPLGRRFYAVWIAFNVVFGVLMGVYHQGGIVPTQLQIPRILDNAVSSKRISLPPGEDRLVDIIWWKTYMPPMWLLGGRNPRSAVHGIQTKDFKGVSGPVLLENLELSVPRCDNDDQSTTNSSVLQYIPTLLVSPASNTFLDPYIAPTYPEQGARPTHLNTKGKLQLHLLSTYKNHLNLDDIDFGDDGMIPTLRRVVGRRGLNVWLVERDCGEGVINA